MTDFHLAQLNIARLLAPLDSPQLADFVDNLDRINALAESMPGFIWRLKDEDGDATSFRPFGEDVIVNMSVWQDVESLKSFVYASDHVNIMRRRAEWFAKMVDAHMVMWWLPAGSRPTFEDAQARLNTLISDGPSLFAFNFARPFPPGE